MADDRASDEITDAELARLGAGIRTWLPRDDHDTWARVLDAMGRKEANPPAPPEGHLPPGFPVNQIDEE